MISRDALGSVCARRRDEIRNRSDGNLVLQTGRKGLTSSVRVTVGLATAGILTTVLLTATGMATVLLGSTVVVAETPAIADRIPAANGAALKLPSRPPVVAKAPNTHTEDDASGRASRQDPLAEKESLLQDVEKRLLQLRDRLEQDERLVESLRKEVAALRAGTKAVSGSVKPAGGEAVPISPANPIEVVRAPAKPAVDIAVQLKEAEQKLAALSARYKDERRQHIYVTLKSMISPEMVDVVTDIENGVPEIVAFGNLLNKFDEADRGISIDEKLARVNARNERMNRDKKKMKDYIREVEDPHTETSRKLNRELETLDSTKLLRAQERLVSRLREELRVLKSTGK
ncbi:MAG TPA: hypothetical protein VHX68_00275 [Planctomycetaceae bacterium]|jgi:hypothetical protein|nr:hypothetical protein [Planctomycetaceae bacterium]